LLWLLPEMPAPAPNNNPFWSDTWSGAKAAFTHREIQRLIPYAVFTHGGFLAISGPLDGAMVSRRGWPDLP